MKGSGNSRVSWKNNFKNIIQKNHDIDSNFSFISANTGKNIVLEECLYDDILPYTLRSSPITTLSKDDNLWIATSMLTRVVDSTNNIVVLEDDFPIGVIGPKEVLNGVLDHPSFDFFNETLASKIMNRNFYLDTRKIKLQKMIEQMKKTKKHFVIVQNSKQGFTGVSIREILEIGAMAKTNLNASHQSVQKILSISRDNTLQEIIRKLVSNDVNYLLLKNENLVLDALSIIEKITTDLDFLRNVDDFLSINTSTLKFRIPKLIPERLEFSEICKLMLEMRYPYLITENRLWTPWDIFDCLNEGMYD